MWRRNTDRGVQGRDVTLESDGRGAGRCCLGNGCRCVIGGHVDREHQVAPGHFTDTERIPDAGFADPFAAVDAALSRTTVSGPSISTTRLTVGFLGVTLLVGIIRLPPRRALRFNSLEPRHYRPVRGCRRCDMVGIGSSRQLRRR